MDDIEFQVRTFVAEIRGIKSIEECPLDARVSHDLGAVGDDAVELFEAFAIKFGVDLTELNKEWDTYFKSEFAENHDPRRLGVGAIVMLPVLGLGIAMDLNRSYFFLLCLIGCLPALVISNYFFPYGPSKKRALPIALMVEAVRLGHWPKASD